MLLIITKMELVELDDTINRDKFKRYGKIERI